MLLVYDHLRHLKQKKHHSLTCFEPNQNKDGLRGRPKGNCYHVLKREFFDYDIILYFNYAHKYTVRKLIPLPFPQNIKHSDVSCVTVL